MALGSTFRNALAKWRIQDSISRKLSVVMLVTFAIAFIITGYFVYKNTEKLYIRIVEQQLRTQSDGIAFQINALLTKQATIIDQMSINQDLVAFMSVSGSEEELRNDPHYAHTMATLNAILGTDQTVGQAWMGSLVQGMAYVSDGEQVAAFKDEIRQRPWYAEAAKSSGNFFTEPYIDYTTQELVVSIIKPIKEDGKVEGFVGIDLFLTSLPEIMQYYELDSGYTFLLSHRGTVLYHPDSRVLMSSNYPPQEDQRIDIAKRMRLGEQALVLTSIDGRKEYIGFAPVTATGWSVGVVIPHKTAMSQLYSYGQTIVVFYTLIVVALVGLIYVLMRFLLRDIPIIISKTRLFSEGYTDVHIKVKSTDEIGQIANAFQQMFYEIRSTMNKIQRDAYYDVLTQLPNRKLLDERFKTAIERSYIHRSKVALVMLDLDNFKQINDTQGHSYGDELIKEVANQLMSISGEHVTAFRFGGDEFIVLVENIAKDANGKQIMALLDPLRQIFERPMMIFGTPVNIAASLGVTLFPDDGQQLGDLLNNADMAMYKAKERGSSKLVPFLRDMKDDIIRRAKIEELLREALAKNQLTLHYQPQIEGASGSVRGFEALLRWSTPELGGISPADFIPIAEETGLINPIGDWAMRTAFLQNKSIHVRDRLRTTMSVNISAVQLKQPDFAERVIRILEETQLEPQYVELEITESNLIESFEAALETLQRLRSFGIKLALDDFGKGYSSLSYIRMLPINNLKIDKSFIQAMMTDETAKTMTESIIALAKRIGLGIVAEGIELEQQLAYLRQFGCDYIQGFLTGRPMPSDQLASFIEKRREACEL